MHAAHVHAPVGCIAARLRARHLGPCPDTQGTYYKIATTGPFWLPACLRRLLVSSQSGLESRSKPVRPATKGACSSHGTQQGEGI